MKIQLIGTGTIPDMTNSASVLINDHILFDVPNGNLTINGVDIDAKKYCKDNYGFDFGEMRYSVGVGFTWITMIGPLSLSYAYPLNDKQGDDTKNIQFEIGRTF